MQVHTAHRDPFRRFTPTPFGADLRVMERTVRLETNSPTVLEQTRRIFECYGRSSTAQAEFLWRIVTEKGPRRSPPWPELAAFSDDGLRYVNLGQRNFLAVDLEARHAVGFLAEELANEELGFACIFLATLFDMTAGALRLTPLSAGCVAMREKGLLVFGSSRSGNTTATYCAGKLGLEFHSDQATFLEMEDGGLHAWGQFWPPAFRSESHQFLPELRDLARPVTYRDMNLWYLRESPSHAPGRYGVTPAFCIFLDRKTAEIPRLVPLSCRQVDERLKESLSFHDDERFEPQCAAVCRALAKLPSYRLAYGSDPAVAAIFFRSLLNARNLLED